MLQYSHVKLGILYLLLLAVVVYCLGLDKLNSSLLYNGFDTISYLEARDALSNHFTFHPTRCIAYPLLLFFVQQVAGDYFFYLMYFLQSIMLWMVLWWQYRWIKQLTNSRMAFGFAIVSLLTISYYLYAFFILTEIACLFFIAVFFEQLKRYLYNRNGIAIFWAILSLSVAVLLKPGMLFFVAIVLLILTVLACFRRFPKKQLLIIYLGICLPLSIQYVGMYGTYKKFTLSYIDKITYYRYFNTSVLALNNQEAILPLMGKRDSLVYQLLPEADKQLSYNYFSSLVRKEQQYLLSEYPLACFKAYGLNLFSNFHTGNTNPKALPKHLARFETANHLFFNITRIENMLYLIALLLITLGFIGWIAVHRKQAELKQAHILWSLVALCFAWYAFLISGVSFYQGDRFNIVWMPFLLPVIATMLQLTGLRTKGTNATPQ